MQIYKKENQKEFNKFLSEISKIQENRRRILSSLPIHTISDDLLLRILKRNKISEEEIEKIIKSVHDIQSLTQLTIKKNKLIDEIEEITSEEKYNSSPQNLVIVNLFNEEKITYSYEEYREHLQLTKEFEKKNKNYELKTNENYTFKNIDIFIQEKKFVIISKHTNPAIHFVIRHPKLRNAIENFTPPIIEKDN